MTNQNGDSVIVLKDVHKSFGKQSVLNGIELQIKKGDTLAVLGRSGTGKSVLLKLLIGLLKPDSGSIQIESKEIANLSRNELNDVRKDIGFVFQNGALYDSLTVEENVAFSMRRHTKMSDSEIRDRVRDLLSKVEMESAIHKMPSEISGGMEKRVGLARALALKPPIMLLDEPTSALDSITSGEILDLIGRLHEEQGTTSVIVTHDLRAVKAISAKASVLDEGKIVATGTIEELEKSDLPFVHKFIQSSSVGGDHV